MEAKSTKITFESKRLIIRTPEEKDIHDVFVLMSDLEIAKSTGFQPMATQSEAEGKIRREKDKQQMFCIAEKVYPANVIGIFEVTPHKTNTSSGKN